MVDRVGDASTQNPGGDGVNISTTNRKRWRLATVMIVAGFLGLVPILDRPASAECRARPDGPGLCPFKIGDVNVLDRCLGAPPFGPDAGQPTSLGSTACDAIEKLGAVQRTVGQSADVMFHQVKR